MLVGFALETDHEEDNAIAKLKKKNLDMIVLNSLQDKDSCFNSEKNTITIIHCDGSRQKYPNMLKSKVAEVLVSEIVSKCLTDK